MNDTSPSAMSQMMTAEDIAKLLKLNVETVRRATRKGKVAYHKFGREKRYDPSDVKTFIDSCRILARP